MSHCPIYLETKIINISSQFEVKFELRGYATEIFFLCQGFIIFSGPGFSLELTEVPELLFSVRLALALALALASAAAAAASDSLCLIAMARASATCAAKGAAARSLQSLAVSGVNQGRKAPA
jgi:hypothetical protein